MELDVPERLLEPETTASVALVSPTIQWSLVSQFPLAALTRKLLI